MTDSVAIIDAYAHTGVAKYKPISQLMEAMEGANVSRAVLVQHLGEFDNQYLAQAMAKFPSTFAGVALVDPFSSDWASRIEAVAAMGFRGLRFHSDWLRSRMAVAVSAANAGFHVVLYMGGPATEVLRPIRELAREVPTASVIIAHLGHPSVDESGAVQGWEVLDLAEEPNISTTLSGLSMWTPHPHQAGSGFVARALSVYGSKRVMWGSNYPVGADAESYSDDLGLIQRSGWELTSDDVSQITSRTAERLWFDR